MGRYFVVPFTYEDVRENRDVDFHLGIEVALIGAEQKLQRDSSLSIGAVWADVRFYKKTMPNLATAEYDGYAEVVFMNEGAMRVCTDYDLPVKVLKVIQEEELPQGLGIEWQKPYLPVNSRNRLRE